MNTPSLEKLSLLVVEDEQSAAEQLRMILGERVGRFEIAYDGMEAYEMYKSIRPDVILTDILMPEMNGLELAGYIRNDDKATEIIFMTAYSDDQKLQEARGLDAVMYIKKPIDPEEILFLLDSISRRKYETVSRFGDGFVFCGDILQKENRTITLSGKVLEVMRYLSRHIGRVVPQEEFENHCDLTPGALRNHISTLNKKAGSKIVKNISGVGYMIEPD